MGQATLPDTPRAGSPGQVEVDDYVGRPAEEAGWLVRRLGLRPGMCQSFGCEPEQRGRVVAQHPPAGETTARNTFVDLYIGVAEHPPDSDTASEQREQSTDQMHTAPARASERGAPKTRRAHTTTSYRFDTPPPPAIPALRYEAPLHAANDEQLPSEGPDADTAEPEDSAAHDQQLPCEDPGADTAESEDSAALNGTQAEFADADILAASEVFMRRTNGHGTGLGGPRKRALRWVRRHPMPGATLVLALGAWVAVALGVTRAHPPAQPPPATAFRSARPSARPRPTHRSASRPGSPVTAHPARRTGSPRPQQRRTHRKTPPRSDAPSAGKVTRQPRTTAAAVSPAARTPAQPPRPAPSPSSGGPFSP